MVKPVFAARVRRHRSPSALSWLGVAVFLSAPSALAQVTVGGSASGTVGAAPATATGSSAASVQAAPVAPPPPAAPPALDQPLPEPLPLDTAAPTEEDPNAAWAERERQVNEASTLTGGVGLLHMQ